MKNDFTGETMMLDLFEGEERKSLAILKKEIVIRTIASCGGNRTAAARELGITRATLYRLERGE